MKRLNTLLLLLFSLLLANCEKNNPNKFSVEGKIKGEFSHYIYLKYQDHIDSTLVSNGIFNFNGSVEKPCQATLYPGSPDSEEIMQLAPFMLENSQISISLTYKKKVLNIAEFEGNAVKILKVDSLYGSRSQELKDQFDSKMGATFYKEKDDLLKSDYLYNNLSEFISANPRFVLSGNYLANLNDRYDYLSSNQVQELYNLLDTSYQDERDLQFVKNIINRRRVLDFGKKPPKILLPNQENKLVNHESFQGKFLLLEFWASWCGPCRETNPELIQVYNSFERKDFEILGISQDKDQNKWKKAIQKDKLQWKQVIDTLNASGKAYHTTTIPFNVLLDREGKIIARDIKPAALKKILTEQLKP